MGTEKNGCEKKCAFDRHEECPACVQNMSHEACTRHFLDRSHASIPRLDTEILVRFPRKNSVVALFMCSLLGIFYFILCLLEAIANIFSTFFSCN